MSDTCETCRHWDPPTGRLVSVLDGSVIEEAETHGACEAIVFTKRDDDRAMVPAIISDYGGGLLTLAEFGCVLHEEEER